MKRIVAILSACMIMVMLCVAPVFAAASLEIESTTPANGDIGMAVDNLGVKLWFNEDMYSKKYDAQQKKCFKLTDADGEDVPIIVAINPEKGSQNEVLVLEDTTSDYKVKQQTEYTLTISEELISAEGNTLSDKTIKEGLTVKFTTLNQKKATTGNMILMFVMMGAIIFFTMRDTKKSAEDEKKKKDEQKVNPYKEAKKSGKSVEEIVAKDEKDKAKRAEKEAAKEAKKEKQKEADRKLEEKERQKIEKERQKARGVEGKSEYVDPSRKKVSRPMPISAAGSTYKTGRKALAEQEAARKAAEEAARKARGTTNPKNKGKSRKKK